MGQVSAKATLEDGSEFESIGRLHMVDLAGSECAKSAGMDSKVFFSAHVYMHTQRMSFTRVTK